MMGGGCGREALFSAKMRRISILSVADPTPKEPTVVYAPRCALLHWGCEYGGLYDTITIELSSGCIAPVTIWPESAYQYQTLVGCFVHSVVLCQGDLANEPPSERHPRDSRDCGWAHPPNYRTHATADACAWGGGDIFGRTGVGW